MSFEAANLPAELQEAPAGGGQGEAGDRAIAPGLAVACGVLRFLVAAGGLGPVQVSVGSLR